MAIQSSQTNRANYLEVVDMSLDDWNKLSKDQQKEKIKSALKGKTKDEIKETLDSLADDIAYEKDSLKELETKLKNGLRHDSNLSAGQKDEVRKWLNEIDALEDDLKSYKKTAEAEAQEISKHNFDISNGTDIQVSGTSIKLDGETYTYQISNSDGNPFGEEAKKNPLEGITSDGTATGKVIKDVDGVDGLNYNDIEVALKKAEADRVTEAQKIFINTPENVKWELASADKQSGDYTFKLTDDKGNVSYVSFKNAKNAIFVFSSGITEKDLDTISHKWPTALLKNCYWEDDEKSFNERIHGKKKSEISEEQRLDVIDGHQQSQDAAKDLYKRYGLKDSEHKEKIIKEYNNVLSDFYSCLDNNNSDKSDAISKKWEQLATQLKQKGYSDNEIITIYQMLIMSLKENAGDNKTIFIDNQITSIESGLLQLGQGHKTTALVLFIEAQVASGPYGGSSAIDQMDTINGKLTNPGKLEVLAELKKMYQQAGISVPSNVKDLEKSIADNLTQEEKIQATGGYYQMSEDEYKKLMGSTKNYSNKYAADISDGVYKEELNGLLGAMVEMLNNNGKNQPVEEMRATLIGFLDSLEEKYQDESAATILQLLHDKAPELFDKLINSSGFCKKMWSYIDNGGNEPENYYQCREWLTGKDSVTNFRYLDDTANGVVDGFEEGYNWGKSVLGDNPAGAALGVVSGAVDGLVQGAKGLIDDGADVLSDVAESDYMPWNW